jgi:hypothetical protein
MAALTSTNIVNQACNLIGNDIPPVTGVAPTFDSSTAGKAAAQLYGLCVTAVGRQFGFDFARNQVALTLTANVPPLGYTYEYAYPMFGGAVALQIYQLVPPFPLADPNNPAPINWTVGNAVVAGTQKKVIWSNLQNASAVCNNNPNESTWDPLFQQAVVRLLASAMAMAIAGKPDLAEGMLTSGSAFESLGETRRD